MFLRVGSRDRASFFQQLAHALDQPERDVRVVFSLREDYLAHLDEARDSLPDVLANSYRLAALDRGNARVAITEPAARAGVTAEPALADALVGQDGHGDLVEANGQVPPAALQIVMDRLYRQALPPGHPEGDLPPPGLTLTLAAYQAFRHVQGQGAEARELSGAEAILAGYLREGLGRLPTLRNEDGTPLDADSALGLAVLKAMVTSQRTKAALTNQEIVAALDEAGAIRLDDDADRRKVKSTVLGLERVRLLRSFNRDNVSYDELAHDYLAREVATCISQAEMEARAVRELLRRQVDSWRRYPDLLIAPEALRLVHEQLEALRKLSDKEIELIFRSALKEGYEVAYWLMRARQAGIPVDDIAREGLRSDSLRTRTAAVTALAELGDTFLEDIIGSLTDNYPQVRVAAIASLERLRPDGAWRSHLKFECYVPAGEFIMGDDSSDRDEEKPAHKVYLDAFYIGKYPVTNAEYARYRKDIAQPFELPKGNKEDYPVVEVNWYDARDYAAWAGMRLLTEAEWEKAASWQAPAAAKEPSKQGVFQRILGQQVQAGKKYKYPYGDTFDKSKCNTSESGIGTTTPVGNYSPAGDSPCGAADMAGNVREWCADWYEENYYRRSPQQNPTGPESGSSRVLRGGSFDNNERFARCASRSHYSPYVRLDDFGFRVCVSPGLSTPLRSGTS